MLLKRILLESLNDIYIVTRCPLPRWQMIWGCCRLFPPITGFDSYGTWPWTSPLIGGCIAIGMNSFLFRSTWVHSWFIGSSCCLCVFVNFCVLSVFVYCCLFLCFPGLYFVLRYCSLIFPFGFSIFFFLHHTIN